MNLFTLLLALVLPKEVVSFSKITNNYCKEVPTADSNSRKEFVKILSPAIGGAMGNGFTIFFLSIVAPPILKAVETIALTKALGNIGAFSTHIDDSDYIS